MTKEEKYLHLLLRKIDSHKSSVLLRFWFDLLLWVAVAIVFFLLIHLQKKEIIGIGIVVGASAVLGVALGFVFAIQSSEKCWKYFKPHINRASIEERLHKIREKMLE